MKNKRLYGALIGLVAITMVGCGEKEATQTSTTETESQVVESQAKTVESDDVVEEVVSEDAEKNIVTCSYGVDFRIDYENKTPEEIEIINSAIEKLNSMTKQERYRLFMDEVEIENTQWDSTEENKVISYLLRVEFIYDTNIDFDNKTSEELEMIISSMNELSKLTKAERGEMFVDNYASLDWESPDEVKVQYCILSIEIMYNTKYEEKRASLDQKPYGLMSQEEKDIMNDEKGNAMVEEVDKISNMTVQEQEQYIQASNGGIVIIDTDGTRTDGNGNLIDIYWNYIDSEGNIIEE